MSTPDAPRVVREIAALRGAIATLRERGADATGRPARVALVPTMGALHDGHLALVRRARELADVVVVSIFVNPLQFAPSEDLDRYPRTMDADLAALAPEGVDLVFAPGVDDMYPHGPSETRVVAGPIGDRYEGAARPGHFDGVLTVVAKLLHIAGPDLVTFGRKDAQQCFLVMRMVADLDLPVEVVPVETVRESDGLALSSRNRYLDDDARAAARALPDALEAAREVAGSGLAEVLAEAAGAFGDHEAAVLDYLVVVDPDTFLPVDDDHRGPARVLVAADVAGTRLLDNADIVLG